MATLFRGPIARRGLGATEIRDPCDGAVGGDHGGDRRDTEDDRAQRLAVVGVENRQPVLDGERHDGDAVAAVVRLRRHSGRADSVLAEPARGERRSNCVAASAVAMTPGSGTFRRGAGGCWPACNKRGTRREIMRRNYPIFALLATVMQITTP